MSEELEAKRDGARLTHNSGRGVVEKGDATLGPFCIDYKEYNESFGVSRSVWSKTTRDALSMRRVPALKLVLGTKEETAAYVDNRLRLWVIPDNMFHEMLEAWQEKYGES